MAFDVRPLVTQWQANRRLRIAVGLALLFAVFNVAASFSASRAETVSTYREQHRLWERLDGAARDAVWTERAAEATAALAQVESTMAAVSGDGEAQAEAQAILQGLAVAAGLPTALVRSEGAVLQRDPMPVWEVAARMDAEGGMLEINQLLASLAAQPWVQVERMDIRDGAPGRVQITVRAYFRNLDAVESASP